MLLSIQTKLKKLYSLNIKLKHDSDKPPDYYQYNMRNKTLADFRLDAYQNENNIKSNMTILKEENDSNKSLNEIKTDEDDFQNNLNMILNEYKNKQNDLILRKEEPSDIEIKVETSKINKKLDKLTDNHNKLPIVFKTFTKPIISNEPIISEDDKRVEILDILFAESKDLNNKKDQLKEKINLISTENEELFCNFANGYHEKKLKNYTVTKEGMTKFLNKFYEKANKYIEKLESKQPQKSILLSSTPPLQHSYDNKSVGSNKSVKTQKSILLSQTHPLQQSYDNKSDASNKSVKTQKSILLSSTFPLHSSYNSLSDVSNKSNPLHNNPVAPKKRGRKAAVQGEYETKEDYDKRVQRNEKAAMYRTNFTAIDEVNAKKTQQQFVNLEIPDTVHHIGTKKSRTSVKQIREIFEGMPDVPTTINESLKSSTKSSIKTPKKLKKSN